MKKKKKILIISIIIAIFIGLSFIKFPYTIYFPGSAMSLKYKVEVGYTISEERGMFIITSVTTVPGYFPLLLYAMVDPKVGIRANAKLHPGLTEKQYKEVLTYLMAESKEVAKIVAMKELGFKVEVKKEGLLIIGVRNDMPAYNVLRVGDVILSIDGKKMEKPSDITEILKEKLPDETVSVTILRNGKEENFKVKVINDRGKNIIGVYVIPKYSAKYPFDIDIKVKKYIGNSAGLMFALEIMNQLTEEDLTRGRIISGTGILDIDGNIHKVGGIVQKVFTAQRAGAYAFLVPYENYREVKGKFQGLNLIPVHNIKEAVSKLLAIPMPKYRPPNQ